jgi:transposase-like protein
VEQARADRTKGRTGLTTAEREELARLRKENRILQEERDILKNSRARREPRYLLDQKLPMRLLSRYPGRSGRLLFGDAAANP